MTTTPTLSAPTATHILCTAAAANNISLVEEIIKNHKYASINMQEAIDEAIHHSNIAICKILYENTKRVHALPNGLLDFTTLAQTHIHECRGIIYIQHTANLAACYDELEILKYLLNKSPEICVQEVFNWASSEYNLDILHWLSLTYNSIQASMAYHIAKYSRVKYYSGYSRDDFEIYEKRRNVLKYFMRAALQPSWKTGQTSPEQDYYRYCRVKNLPKCYILECHTVDKIIQSITKSYAQSFTGKL